MSCSDWPSRFPPPRLCTVTFHPARNLPHRKTILRTFPLVPIFSLCHVSPPELVPRASTVTGATPVNVAVQAVPTTVNRANHRSSHRQTMVDHRTSNTGRGSGWAGWIGFLVGQIVTGLGPPRGNHVSTDRQAAWRRGINPPAFEPTTSQQHTEQPEIINEDRVD
ncbi:hypothetical protein Tco_0493890 [Tanacetum coccineum]